MIELTKPQKDDLARLLTSGVFGSVGEYRGCVVRSFAVADKLKPGVKINRVVVEHNVEFGGSPLVVGEWLPEGADEKAVKAPANRGDVVFATIAGLKWEKGVRKCSGSVKTLAVLV